MAHRLVGYTLRLKGGTAFPDTYLTQQGFYTREFKPVLSCEQAEIALEDYMNSGAFLQLLTVTPVYDYRRRV